MNEAQYNIFRSMVESFVAGKEKALAGIKEHPNEDAHVQQLLETSCESEARAYQQVLSLLDTLKTMQ